MLCACLLRSQSCHLTFNISVFLWFNGLLISCLSSVVSCPWLLCSLLFIAAGPWAEEAEGKTAFSSSLHLQFHCKLSSPKHFYTVKLRLLLFSVQLGPYGSGWRSLWIQAAAEPLEVKWNVSWPLKQTAVTFHCRNFSWSLWCWWPCCTSSHDKMWKSESARCHFSPQDVWMNLDRSRFSLFHTELWV